jgi:metal-dependent amidase/aminoacylase/carboxypeptidase family protein
MNPEKIKDLARQFADEIISIRRALHANPELSFEEHNTSLFIESKLDEWGIKHERVATTGITGIIDGAGRG